MAIVTIDGIPVYQALVGAADTGMLRISLVDDPAVQSDFVAFAAQRKALSYAVEDEEKRLVLGVVMRADFPIYRRDAKMGEYYIIYSADTIRQMAEKYLLDGRQNEVNLMHVDGSEVDGVDMVQYFIKDSAKGVAPAGFDGIADGSLFAEFHVVNDEVWDAIKAGTYKGFSLEGIFDLAPETDRGLVEDIVDALDGVFRKIFKPLKYEKMTKVKGLLARLAKALVEMGNITTDKGILAWDGDEDLKAGDAVYIEDENGERSKPEDGDYTTEDGKVIVVADGTVSEIRDLEAQVAPEEGAETFGSVATDKGSLEWDGEEDLKAGDAVFTRDEEGNRVPAADGDYVTEDGKTIVVAEGIVSEIRDAEAEVAPEEAPEVDARKAEKMSRKQEMEASYDEKYRLIAEAVAAVLDGDFYILEAGDDFAVVDTWDEDYVDRYYRYSVSWNEDGTANVADPVEVKKIWVPLDFVSPFEEGASAAEQEAAALRQENEALRAEVEQLKQQPAARTAHEEFSGATAPAKTGNKGLDRITRIMSAGE